MKKPIIKNWIKYWTTTIAVSGMLALGACDNNGNQTADNTADNIETTTEETITSTRENVNQGMEEVETETEQVVDAGMDTEESNAATDQIEYERTASAAEPSDISANAIGNMDSHLEEHEDANEAIKEELTDTNLSQQNITTDSQGYTDLSVQENQEIQNPTQQQNSLDDQPGTTDMNQNTASEDPVMVYERYIMVYGDDLDEENRKRMEDIGREYRERRESMRGEMDQETGAYVSPEVDPQPKQGYNELMTQIQENIDYPHNAVAAEMEGTVYVNFILDENGNVTKAKAFEDVIVPPSNLVSATSPLNPTSFSEQEIEELRKEMRKEAVRAVKETSGMWEPGMQDGQAVKTEVQLPVQFNILEVE